MSAYAERVEELEASAAELIEARNKQRLALAARIAAGLCAHPHVCEGQGWRKQAAHDAWAIAGHLQTIAESGGC